MTITVRLLVPTVPPALLLQRTTRYYPAISVQFLTRETWLILLCPKFISSISHFKNTDMFLSDFWQQLLSCGIIHSLLICLVISSNSTPDKL